MNYMIQNLVLQGYFSRLHMCKFDQQEASIHSGKVGAKTPAEF